jgi:hypothetical protein
VAPRQTEGSTELSQGRRVAAGFRPGAPRRIYEAVLTRAGYEVLVTGALRVAVAATALTVVVAAAE